jgi:hypothetical protein
MFLFLFWGMSRVTMFENGGVKTNALGYLCPLLSGEAAIQSRWVIVVIILNRYYDIDYLNNLGE